jgi:hypothetical protein
MLKTLKRVGEIKYKYHELTKFELPGINGN